MSTNSPILNMPLVAPNQNQKEATINTGLATLEAASNQNISLGAANSDLTLTTDQFTQNFLFEIIAATVARNLIIPATPRYFAVANNCTANITVKIAGSSGTSVLIPPSKTALCVSDGTNVVTLTPGVIGGAPGLLEQLSDYNGAVATNGQVLQFNTETNLWGPVTLPTPITTFASLTDAPQGGYYGNAGKLIGVNENGSGLVYVTSAANIHNFTDLDDTPKSYANYGLAKLRVNQAGNGVEFAYPDLTDNSDFPNNYNGANGKFLRVGSIAGPNNTTVPSVVFGTAATADLSDGPGAPTVAKSLYYVRINQAGTGLEYALGTGGPDHFTQLLDCPQNYTGAANKFVQVNAGGTGLQYGVPAFTGLSDAPTSYTGQAGKFLQVNSGASGVQFATPTFAGLSDGAGSLNNNALKVVRVNAATTALEYRTLAITDLAAFPSSFTGQGGKYLVVKPDGSGVQFTSANYTAAFTTLTDTPQSYAGKAGQLVAVDPAATGLVFISPSSVGTTTLSGLTDIDESTAPVGGQVLTFNATTAKWQPKTPAATGPANSSGALTGAGAPTAAEPMGTLYTRNDQPGVYVSDPTTVSGGAVVQSVSQTLNAQSPSATLPSAPTQGNWLIAFVTYSDAAPSVGQGWTVLTSTGAPTTGDGMVIYYKQAAAGESTFQSPATTPTAGGAMALLELTGLPSTWSAAYQSGTVAAALSAAPTVTPATSETTTGTYNLAIAAFGGDAASGLTHATFPAGWTLETSTDGTGVRVLSVAATSLSAGATVDPVGTFNETVTAAQYGVLVFTANPGLAAGWLPISETILLENLADVDGTLGAYDGQVLTFSATEGKWKPGTVSGGSGSGSAAGVPTAAQPHLYWRLYVNTINAGDQGFSTPASIEGIAFRSVSGGPSVCTGGTAIASGYYQNNAGYAPANPFQSGGGIWASYGPGSGSWIGYQFAAPVAIRQVMIQARSAYASECPTTAVVQFSDDGASWQDAWDVQTYYPPANDAVFTWAMPAMTAGAGANGATTLSTLTDVDETTAPTAGQVLTYNATESKWKPAAPAAGATALAALTDVDETTAPTVGQVLTFNAEGKWKPAAAPAAGASTLAGLTDVDETTAPTAGQVLTFNAEGKWKPATVPSGTGGGSSTLAGLTDVDESTAPTDGQALVYSASEQKWKPESVSSGSGTTNVAGTTVAIIPGFAPPLPATFPTLLPVSNTPTLTSDVMGLVLSTGAPTNANTLTLSAALKPVPTATTWQATFKLSSAMIDQEYMSAYAVMQEASTGKLIAFGWTGGIGIEVVHYNSLTSYNSTPYSKTMVTRDRFLRISCDGTNYYFSVSSNLTDFYEIYQEAMTAGFTAAASSVGFCLNAQNNFDSARLYGPCSVTLSYYADTSTPPVASAGAASLSMLADVDESTAPINGQALVYNAFEEKWKPGTVAAAGSGSGSTTVVGYGWGGAHAYWRVNSTGPTAGGQATGLAEVVFAATPGGPSQATGGVAIGSSQFGGANVYAAAFDGNPSTAWGTVNGASGAGNWIGYNFPAPVTVKEVRLSARNDGYANQAPTAFTIGYSDDGVTWFDGPFQFEQLTWTNGQTVVVEVPTQPTLLSVGLATTSPMLATTVLQRSQNLSLTSSNWTLVTWDTPVHDELSAHNTTNPERITIPNGVTRARFTFYATWDNSGGTARYLALAKNGVDVAANGVQSQINAHDNESSCVLVSAWLDVTPGDYFNVLVDSGGDTVNLHGNAVLPAFGGPSYFQAEFASSLTSAPATATTVQQAYGRGNGNVTATLPGAPTTGNMLVAIFAGGNSGLPAVPAGWSAVYTNTTAEQYQLGGVYICPVTASTSQALTLDFTDESSLVLMEVANLNYIEANFIGVASGATELAYAQAMRSGALRYVMFETDGAATLGSVTAPATLIHNFDTTVGGSNHAAAFASLPTNYAGPISVNWSSTPGSYAAILTVNLYGQSNTAVAASAVNALKLLTDVDESNLPTNGQVLTYSTLTGKWKPAAIPTPTTTLAALTDVDETTAPTAGQVLTWNAGEAKWKPATPASSGGSSSSGSSVFGINTQTASYVLAPSDAGGVVRMNSGSPTTLTVPAFATVPFAVGANVSVSRKGAGSVTLVAANGVTLDYPIDLPLTLRKQNSTITLINVAQDEWLVAGDLG